MCVVCAEDCNDGADTTNQLLWTRRMLNGKGKRRRSPLLDDKLWLAFEASHKVWRHKTFQQGAPQKGVKPGVKALYRNPPPRSGIRKRRK